MMTEPNLIAIAAHQLAFTNTRLVISEHNMLSHSIDSIKDRVVTLGAWASYSLADHTVAVSKGVRDDLLETTRLEDSSISMIYNPVRVESIQEQASEPADHEWLADDSLEVVLSGGRHEPQKGFDTLLDAFARLERDDIRLALFGKGPETETLQRQAIELGISDHVSFLGFVDNPYSYMSAADVFVLSSVREGFGLVLIEAMACGCPVVSTDCESGPDEILDSGEYGSLVPVGNDESLADGIKQTLGSPQHSSILQSRAAEFSIENILPQYESVFQLGPKIAESKS
jgi:glycosyltransferase involved in cell wall biosynthesis